MQAKDSETVSQELSTVLRDFLELQFEISAPVQTTKELLSDVSHRKILQPELTKRFSKLFAIADQAKFAGLSLTESQFDKVFDEARSVITKASQVEQTTEAEVANASDEHHDGRTKRLVSSNTSFKEPV